jgi:acetoacetate decarboxylase
MARGYGLDPAPRCGTIGALASARGRMPAHTPMPNDALWGDTPMAWQGRLTLDKIGNTMPADSPAYQAPPYYYRNVQAIAVSFETDPDAALGALPAPLTLQQPATAALSFYDYPWTTFGPYKEAILALMVEHQGKPMAYIQQIVVDTEPPMLAGRELWGYPKKLAKITYQTERDMIFGTMERPASIRLASCIVRPERPAPSSIKPISTAASLRILPAADPDAKKPLCAEIVETNVAVTLREAWVGTGSVAFAEHSALDPWDRFPVKRVLQAVHMTYDMVLPCGRVIAQL